MNSHIQANLVTFEVIATLILIVILTGFVCVALAQRLRNSVVAALPIFVSALLGAGMLGIRMTLEPMLVSDELTWHLQGLQVASFLSGTSESVDNLHAGKEGYAWIVGLLYWVAAPAPMLAIALGSLALVLLVPITGLIAEAVARNLALNEGVAQRAARGGMFFIALCPTIVFWAPRMLRETLCMLLIAIAILSFLRLIESPRVIRLLVLVLAITALTAVRGQVGVGLAAAFALSGILIWTFRFPSWGARVLIILPTFIILFSATWVFVDSTADLSVENTAYRNVALAEASSSFAGSEALRGADSYADIVLFNLPRVAAGPFPGELSGSPVMLLAAVSNIFWVSCAAGAMLLWRLRFKPARHENAIARDWRTAAVLITLVLALVAILSINAGNYGGVVRMRLMPLVALVPLAMVGFSALSMESVGDVIQHRTQRATARR